nr:PREDICTED: transcription initiation factor TFIID subunit 4-like isoform X2 [Latimeria chalumnae]|eukprot:XP_006003214.1 PREDICTED: transcription initiation factor TFIID subunit 4-like isoform X2 [Latimeria chalumnae]
MAGASDPLEDMLFSEVDEKAVSDLVGSLESQLAGQRAAAPPQSEMRTAGAVSNHLGIPSAQVSAVQQLEEEEGKGQQGAAGLNQESSSRLGSSVKNVTPVFGSPTSAFGGSSSTSGSGVNDVNSSEMQSHGAASSCLPAANAPELVTLPSSLVSVRPSNGGAGVLGSAAAGTGTATAEPLKNPGVSTVRTVSSGVPSVNGSSGVVNSSTAGIASYCAGAGAALAVNTIVTSRSVVVSTVNSNLTVASNTSSTAFTANRIAFPPSQTSVVVDSASTPTIALQRPPMHISSIAQNGNGTSNSPALIQSVARVGTPAEITQVVNHQSTVVSPKVDSITQSKLVLQSRPGTINTLTNSVTPVMNLPTNSPQNSVAKSVPVVSSPVSHNTIVKPGIHVLGPSGSSVGVLKPGIPPPIMSTATQSQPPRPGVGPPQRIGPQLIVRPPQQTTIHLPPGLTIPPGMILIRTETGQLIMVPQQALAQAQAHAQGHTSSSVSSRLSTTSGQVFRSSSTQQLPVPTPGVGLKPPVLPKVIQSSASSPTGAPTPAVQPVSIAGQSSKVSVAVTNTQTLYTTATTRTMIPTPPAAVNTGVQPQASAQPQGLPRTQVSNQPGVQTQAHAQAIPGSPSPGINTVSQEMQENVKKCKNFLATLIKLASHNPPSPETSRNVKSLVQDLLDAKINPEEFTCRLQTELKSSPQPYLVPFLKKSLPALRQTLLNSQSFMQGQQHQPQQPQQTKLNQVVPSTAQCCTISSTTTSTIRLGQPNSVTLPTTVQQQGQNSQLQIIQTSSPQVAKRQPVGQTTQVRMPVVITQSIRQPGTVGKVPTIQTSKSPGGVGVEVSANVKNKLNDPGGGSYREEDEINDVASMAGVNLSEESAQILATNSDLVGTQIRSCKDEAFLADGPLHKRILETAKRFGVTEVPNEVVSFVSHATQDRLRSMIEKVTVIAQHRMETYKDDEWYEQATDVRSQLKFFEQLERLEKQRKDEQEREILLKAAKSRSRQEDPEQARLKQKAKEMQQQELAQMRQRDANLTALAAIGPRKKRKLDLPGPTAAGGERICDCGANL